MQSGLGLLVRDLASTPSIRLNNRVLVTGVPGEKSDVPGDAVGQRLPRRCRQDITVDTAADILVHNVCPPGVDINAARFAQKPYSEAFSKRELFGGRTIDDVAGLLKSDAWSPDDVPINVVVRDGSTLITNTRTAQALIRAGVPRESWNVVDQTGNPLYENLVSRQLSRNGLSSSGYELPSRQ